jgi:hypothetical protein
MIDFASHAGRNNEGAAAPPKNPFALSWFQWLFGVAAPAACVAADFIYFDALPFTAAPTAIWLLVILGPIVLIASQWPGKELRLRVLAAAAFGCAIAALLIALLLSLLALGVAPHLPGVLLVPPVAFACFWAYLRHALLLIGKSPLWITSTLGGVAFVAFIGGADALDRFYFEAHLKDIRNGTAQEAVLALGRLHFYPLAPTVRGHAVCRAVTQTLPSRTSLDALRIEEAARSLLGREFDNGCPGNMFW